MIRYWIVTHWRDGKWYNESGCIVAAESADEAEDLGRDALTRYGVKPEDKVQIVAADTFEGKGVLTTWDH